MKLLKMLNKLKKNNNILKLRTFSFFSLYIGKSSKLDQADYQLCLFL